jgi:hypothetical protein
MKQALAIKRNLACRHSTFVCFAGAGKVNIVSNDEGVFYQCTPSEQYGLKHSPANGASDFLKEYPI